MADWTSLTYVVVDVEGNGHQPPDLVELAAVPIVGGIIGEPTSWLVQPDQPIKYFATRIHGLTDQDVSAAPRFAAIKDEVLAAVDADALVAHNAHVDMSVLSRKLGDWKTPEVFDTLKLARRLLPDVGSYKLGALVEKLKLAETTTGHALACLYAADRYHHLEVEVRPNTNAGRVVISDRYIPSALVMQRFDGIDPAFLWQLNASAQPLSALTR